ncbi:MAG: hypothetical protein H0Z33_06075 [Bacillaceae bacterium]|nr:hypothetical protein [Bacillaceae bacterium]
MNKKITLSILSFWTSLILVFVSALIYLMPAVTNFSFNDATEILLYIMGLFSLLTILMAFVGLFKDKGSLKIFGFLDIAINIVAILPFYGLC